MLNLRAVLAVAGGVGKGAEAEGQRAANSVGIGPAGAGMLATATGLVGEGVGGQGVIRTVTAVREQRGGVACGVVTPDIVLSTAPSIETSR